MIFLPGKVEECSWKANSTQWGTERGLWRLTKHTEPNPVFRGDPCGRITPASPLAADCRVSRSLPPQPYKSRPCSQILKPQPVIASEVWPIYSAERCLQLKEQHVLKTQERTSRYTWQPNRAHPPEANTSWTPEPCAGLWGGDSLR